MKKPLVLMILDGWGYSEEKENNAVYSANTPNLDYYIKNYPDTLLKCSGKDVGLPDGLMGNSEVGHLNIGAGRIVYQDISRIDKSIKDRSFFKNEFFLKAYKIAKENNSKIHLIGLLSDGGVHSMDTHLYSLIKMYADLGFKDLIVHPIFDGRDTAPMVGDKYLSELINVFEEHGTGRLGAISGRYFAMDRDKRWDRVKKAYDVLTGAKEKEKINPIDYVKESHKKGIGDEFIEPALFGESIKDKDVIIFFNFRSDRARELTKSFIEKDFNFFKKDKNIELSYFLTMTEYDNTFKVDNAFPKQSLKNIMGEVISNHGMNQLRIAETEKYAHVTFFFNGGVEENFSNEDRILINSPREVATYDLKPEMSALEVTDKLLENLNKYDFVVVNYANCDMVGHTGNFDATVKAVETVDKCSARIIKKVLDLDGMVFLTADHGNAEKMKEEGDYHTAHTTNDVRFIIIANSLTKNCYKLRKGRLSDIMPTILYFMGIEKPAEVTGENLIINKC